MCQINPKQAERNTAMLEVAWWMYGGLRSRKFALFKTLRLETQNKPAHAGTDMGSAVIYRNNIPMLGPASQACKKA